MSEPMIELDPTSPFEAIIVEMVKLHRRKRADYALDGDALSNFFNTAAAMRAKGHEGFDALTSVDYLLAVKEARLAALAANGRMDQAANESVRDTLIDAANYSVLKLAIYDRLQELKEPRECASIDPDPANRPSGGVRPATQIYDGLPGGGV